MEASAGAQLQDAGGAGKISVILSFDFSQPRKDGNKEVYIAVSLASTATNQAFVPGDMPGGFMNFGGIYWNKGSVIDITKTLGEAFSKIPKKDEDAPSVESADEEPPKEKAQTPACAICMELFQELDKSDKKFFFSHCSKSDGDKKKLCEYTQGLIRFSMQINQRGLVRRIAGPIVPFLGSQAADQYAQFKESRPNLFTNDVIDASAACRDIQVACFVSDTDAEIDLRYSSAITARMGTVVKAKHLAHLSRKNVKAMESHISEKHKFMGSFKVPTCKYKSAAYKSQVENRLQCEAQCKSEWEPDCLGVMFYPDGRAVPPGKKKINCWTCTSLEMMEATDPAKGSFKSRFKLPDCKTKTCVGMADNEAACEKKCSDIRHCVGVMFYPWPPYPVASPPPPRPAPSSGNCWTCSSHEMMEGSDGGIFLPKPTDEASDEAREAPKVEQQTAPKATGQSASQSASLSPK